MHNNGFFFHGLRSATDWENNETEINSHALQASAFTTAAAFIQAYTV